MRSRLLFILILISSITYSQYAQQYVMTKVSFRNLVDIQLDLFKKYQSFSPQFYDKWSQGQLLSRIFADVEQLRGCLMHAFERFLPGVLTVFGVTVYLFFLSCIF